jgi:hypothetical protein
MDEELEDFRRRPTAVTGMSINHHFNRENWMKGKIRLYSHQHQPFRLAIG